MVTVASPFEVIAALFWTKRPPSYELSPGGFHLLSTVSALTGNRPEKSVSYAELVKNIRAPLDVVAMHMHEVRYHEFAQSRADDAVRWLNRGCMRIDVGHFAWLALTFAENNRGYIDGEETIKTAFFDRLKNHNGATRALSQTRLRLTERGAAYCRSGHLPANNMVPR